MAEYPSEQALKIIKEWDIVKDGLKALFDFIQGEWSEYGWQRRTRTRLYLSTGGWSGNEDIITVMKCNHLFWSISWIQSRRGGHYVFEVKEINK
jgi:hypothetical protein